MSVSSIHRFKPEHQIEQRHFAVCVFSRHGELKPREAPVVINDSRGGCTSFVNFVALPREEFQLFVRNYSPFNASADILFRGKSFGKWLIAHKTQTWQHIGGDTLFEFKDTDDRPFKAVEPLASAIEIRFQYLSRVAEGRKRGNLVPVIVRDPSWEDGSGWLPLSDGLMTSRFKAKEDNAFLTFVASFYTPRTTTSPSVPAPLMVNRNAALGSNLYPNGSATASPVSMSQMTSLRRDVIQPFPRGAFGVQSGLSPPRAFDGGEDGVTTTRRRRLRRRRRP